MIEKTVTTIGCIVLVIALVSLASADSSQSLSVSQEFDDNSNVQAAAPVKQTAPPQNTTIGKQDLSAANAKSDQIPPPSVGGTDQKAAPSRDGSWKDTLTSLLPSKQDLDKAFKEEGGATWPRPRANWGEASR